MEFGDYVQQAAEKSGGIPALATIIEQLPDIIRKARRGERGLPEKACVLIAQILNVEPITIIAARERTLAKNDADRAFWKKVASFAAVALIGGTALPPESHAATTSMASSLGDNEYYVKCNCWADQRPVPVRQEPLLPTWCNHFGLPRS